MNQRYDVVVVGAGVAGVCAAVTAARLKRRTLLLEQEAEPGGTVSAALHQYICGLFANDPDRPFTLLNEGLVREIVDALDAAACNEPRTVIGKVEVYGCDRLSLIGVLMRLICAEPELDVCFNAHCAAADVRDGCITSLTVRTLNEEFQVDADVFLDATGTGSMMRLFDGAYDLPTPEELQLAGFSMLLSGVDCADDMLPVKVPYALARAAAGGSFPDELKFSTMSVSFFDHTCLLKLSVPAKIEPDLPDKVVALLQSELPSLADTSVLVKSPRAIPREGARLKGECMLTERNVLGAQECRYPSVKAAWPIEFWNPDHGPRLSYVPSGKYYHIPDSCFRSSVLRNLYAAGSCISADRKALASARVAGTCMATGEAAARYAVLKGVS